MSTHILLDRDLECDTDANTYTIVLMNEIALEGYLLRSKGDALRFVTGSLCLELDRRDVLGIEDMQLPDGVEPGIGAPVCLTIRPGAGLLNAYSAAPFERKLRVGRRPFAFAARPNPAQVIDAPDYRELERAFLEQHGLGPNSPS